VSIRTHKSYFCSAVKNRFGLPGVVVIDDGLLREGQPPCQMRSETNRNLSREVRCNTRIVAGLPESGGFALAGGAALVVAGVIDRDTRDLDFFGPSAEDVQRLCVAVESALPAAGLRVRRERHSATFVRLSVSDGELSTEVDLAADARIRPAELGPLGPMLAIEELAADKLLALFDRAQGRDFRDVAALIERFGLERLCQLAVEKDRGFSTIVLAEMLGTFDRFSAEELGIDESARRELSRAVGQWHGELAGLARRPTRPRGPEPDLSL
jgi:hypothetical protein